MPEYDISNKNASNSGVVSRDDTYSTDKNPKKLEMTKIESEMAVLEDSIVTEN